MGEKEEKPKDNGIKVEHDLANEQVIIASAIHDLTTREDLVAKIPAGYFTDKDHQKIWAAMIAIRKAGLKFDLPALHKELAGSVAIAYIAELTKSHPKAAINIRDHVNTLQWDVAKKNAIEGPLSDMLKSIRANDDPARIRGFAKRTATAFDVKLGNKYMKNPTELAAAAAKDVRDRKKAGHYTYGIDELDYFDDGKPRMIPGCSPGGTTLITGVSGSAKSTIAARLVLEQARMKKKVLVGAWEMGAVPTIGLLACMSRGWPREKVSLGLMTEEELLEFEDTCEAIGQYVKFFDAPFSDAPVAKHTNEAALDTLYQNIADSGAVLCVMDLWERMIPDATPDRERRALFLQQAIAQETMVHCMLVCQQKSKAVEATSLKIPTRNFILGSSAWVDIADTIIGIHRPGLWRTGVDDDILEMLILKQRYGKWPLGIQFDWDGELGSISNGHEIDFPQDTGDKKDWLG